MPYNNVVVAAHNGQFLVVKSYAEMFLPDQMLIAYAEPSVTKTRHLQNDTCATVVTLHMFII